MQNIPKWSFLVGEPMVVGYQHFRKPPYQSHLAWTAFCNRCLVAPCSLWWQADSKELLESVEPWENWGSMGQVFCTTDFGKALFEHDSLLFIYIYISFVYLCITLHNPCIKLDLCMIVCYFGKMFFFFQQLQHSKWPMYFERRVGWSPCEKISDD